MIAATYTVNRPEYLEAQRLFIRHRAKRNRVWRIFLFCILFVGLFIFLSATTNFHQTLLVTGIAALISIALGLLLKYVLQATMLRRRFGTEARLLTNVQITLDASEFRSDTSGIGQGTMEWQAFTAWLEGEHVIVLTIGYLFRPIPKRVLSPPEILELRTLLEQKIGPKNVIRKL